MTEAPIASLEELLRALARERSLRGRLRVLGHSWALLRSLSRAEREQVALRIGSRWAWQRVEKAFLRDGELSEGEQLVGQAFERMGKSDPRELRRLAHAIREGDGGAARDLLLMTLTEALEEEADEEEDGPRTGGAVEAEPQARPGAAPADESEAASELASVAELVERAEDVLASTLARSVPASPEHPEAADELEAEPEPPAAPPMSSSASAPAVRPAFPPASPKEPEVRQAGPPSPEPGPQPPVLAAIAPRTDSQAPSTATGRLRVLRALQQSDRPGAELGRDGRAALLGSLAGSWAARRALSRMIRTRALDDLDEALDLIRKLAHTSQQSWCLADLLAYWKLDPTQRERVLRAAPTDAARRRLARRSTARARTAGGT